MNDVIRHVLIRGAVQGVGFSLLDEADRAARGLVGWVRIAAGIGVEAVSAGPRTSSDRNDRAVPSRARYGTG